MGSVGFQVWQWVAAVIAAVLVAVGAIFAPSSLKARIGRYVWWFVGLAAVAIGWLFLFYLRRKYPPDGFATSALPEEFRPAYWQWLYVLLMGGLASGIGLFLQLRQTRKVREQSLGSSGFPDLDSAWDEILLRLDQAGIEAKNQRFFLMLAPSEDSSAAVIEAAGLQVFAHGPADEAPIHATASADGVFLSIAGASNLGGPGDPLASSRLEHLCQLVLDLNPDCPVVRAVVVILPIEWCSRPESIKEAAGVRDDLQRIQRGLNVRCPVFAVFSGMETVPGFMDFAFGLGTQVSRQMLDQRVGFAIPAREEFREDLVHRGLVWQSGWFQVWALNLMAGDPFNDRANGELVTLEAEFRRYRKRLRTILESAFSTHQGTRSILFRGCYFVATGARREDRAFAAALFRGSRSRVVADSVAAEWTEVADRVDRRYFWSAIVIGVVGLVANLWVWSFVGTRTPTLGMVGMIALGILWLAGGFWISRSSRKAGIN